jgi:hypothetical protein
VPMSVGHRDMTPLIPHKTREDKSVPVRLGRIGTSPDSYRNTSIHRQLLVRSCLTDNCRRGLRIKLVASNPTLWSVAVPTRRGVANKRRSKSRRRLIIIIAIVSLVWGAIVLSVFACLLALAEKVKEANRVAAAVDRATSGREGEDWTLNELFSYLEAKGAVSSMEVVDNDRDELPPEWVFKTADNRTVRVRRLDNAQDAAGDANRIHLGTAFSWGRFSFMGDSVANDRFRKWLYE